MMELDDIDLLVICLEGLSPKPWGVLRSLTRRDSDGLPQHALHSCAVC